MISSPGSVHASWRRAACFAAALAGCAHHFPLATNTPAHGLAGIPVPFGDGAQQVPEGTKVHWAFGDGLEADGPVVSHAFGKAGDFTVIESVTDSSGTRTGSIPAHIDRRGPWMAVPPEARSALVLDHLFNHLTRVRGFLSHLSSPQHVEQTFDQFTTALGFDPRQPEQVLKAGIDPDKGLALINFDEEPNTNYAAIGILDQALADDAVRKALTAMGAVFEAGPDGWTVAAVGLQPYHFHFDRGYLLIRLPADDHPEPPLALSRFAHASDTGLQGDPGFVSLRGSMDSGDVDYYLARSALIAPDAKPSPNPIAARVNAGVQRALLTLIATDTDLDGQGRLALDADGRAAAASLFGGTSVPTLPSRAPAGAAAYASFSGDVPGLIDLLGGVPAAGADGKGRLSAMLSSEHLDLQMLLGMVAGDVAAAGYFDPAAFFRSMVATQSPIPQGDLLVGTTTKEPASPLPIIESALAAAHASVSKRELSPGRVRLDFSLDGHPAGALVSGREVTLAYGTRTFDQLTTLAPADPRLETELRAALPTEAFSPGRLVGYLNVGRIVEQLGGDVVIPGVSGGELLQARLMTQVVASQFSSIKDLALVMQPSAEGLALHVRLRLR